MSNSERNCPRCGVLVKDTITVCENCGSVLPPSEPPKTSRSFGTYRTTEEDRSSDRSAYDSYDAGIVCPSCGAPNSYGERVCYRCGKNLPRRRDLSPLAAGCMDFLDFIIQILCCICICG